MAVPELRSRQPGMMTISSLTISVAFIYSLAALLLPGPMGFFCELVTLIQNLAWATGYNVVVLPLAAGVLAPWGILLSPAAGAVLMSLSTIIVAINAQTLRGMRLGM